MSAVVRLPSRSWAGAHRAAVLALTFAVLLVAVTVTGAAVLLSRDTAAGSGTVPQELGYVVDTCGDAPVQTAC